MAMFDATLFPFGVGIIAIIIAVFIIRWILKKDSGTDRMKEVSGYIVVGTRAYLNRQLKTIFLAMPWIAALLSYIFGWQTSLTFIYGALLSLLAGYIGMNVAVRANVRATNAARKSSAVLRIFRSLSDSGSAQALPLYSHRSVAAYSQNPRISELT